MQAVQQVGAACGVATLVSVFGTASRHQDVLSPADFVDAVGPAYAAGAGLAVVVLIVVWTLVRPPPRDRACARCRLSQAP